MLGHLGLLLATTLPLTLAAGSSSQCPDGAGFAFPNHTDPSDQNLVFNLGQKINIQWKSPWAAVKLAFIGEDSDTFIFIDGLSGGEDKSNFQWNVNVNNSKNDNDQYYLYFEDASNNQHNCYSSLWSIRDPSKAGNSNNGPSTVTTPITTRTPTPTGGIGIQTTTGAHGLTTVVVTTGLTSPTDAAARNSPSPAPTVIASEGLSTGAKAGIGVGVALGVIAIVGFIAAAILYFRRKKAAQNEMQPDSAYAGGAPGMYKEPMGVVDQTGGAGGFYAPKAPAPAPVPLAPQELDSAAVAPGRHMPVRQNTLHEMSG